MIASLSRPSIPVLGRLGPLALLLLLEIAGLSIWVDNGSLDNSGRWVALIAEWGATAARFVVAFSLFWIAFGRARAGAAFVELETAAPLKIRPVWVSIHAVSLLLFGWLSQSLYGGTGSREGLAQAWIGAGAAVALSAALIFIPWPVWRVLIVRTADIWGFGLAATATALALVGGARSLWEPLSELTFRVSAQLLSLVTPRVESNVAERILGTDRFQVRIAPECSGFEGIALVLVFGGAWLWFFRAEYRFPRALILLPAAVGAIWSLNALRIAGLIWLGHAGWEGIAVGGFHSQAGWIAFVTVSLALCWASRRWRWIAREAVSLQITPAAAAATDWTAPWLMPFLAILGAGLIVRAASSTFEWLYPLKVVAAAAILWTYREEYRRLDWRLSWAAPVAGVAVFGLWMGLERLFPAAPNSAIRDGLAALAPWQALGWTAFRVLGASVTVPVAEELAFRGFLQRRLVSPQFTQVDPRIFYAAAWFGSSLAFGLLHGDRWLAGTFAGLIYAWAYSRRGSIGDAAAAHGITNALLAAWVLMTGETQLW